MQREPLQLQANKTRASRLSRHDAVRRAHHVVTESTGDATPGQNTLHALDAAFADLPDADSEERPTVGIVAQITSQLKQLDAQRSHLQSLLDDVQD